MRDLKTVKQWLLVSVASIRFLEETTIEGPEGEESAEGAPSQVTLGKFYMQICTFWCFWGIGGRGDNLLSPQYFYWRTAIAPSSPLPPGSTRLSGLNYVETEDSWLFQFLSMPRSDMFLSMCQPHVNSLQWQS